MERRLAYQIYPFAVYSAFCFFVELDFIKLRSQVVLIGFDVLLG